MNSVFGRRGAAILLTTLLFVPVTKSKTVLLEASDNNSHVCLYVGDTLTIKLESNPTTGYSWAKPSAPALLTLLSLQTERGATNRVGTPGAQIFTFKASKAGESAVVLNYVRPWEKNAAPAKIFRVSVTVEERARAGSSQK